jgi:hypothetical protein
MNFTALILAGSLTALGVGCFCVDMYRNRNRRSSETNESTDLAVGGAIDLAIFDVELSDLPAGEQISHAVSESGHSIGHAIGHGVETITHTLSHF